MTSTQQQLAVRGAGRLVPAPDQKPRAGDEELARALERLGRGFYVLRGDGGQAVLDRAAALYPDGADGAPPDALELLAIAPALLPGALGDPAFLATHGLRLPLVAGAMANGIASVELVEAVGRAGMLGFFGAAGLAPDEVEAQLERLERSLGAEGLPWGSNLIHSPGEPELEAAVADLYLRRGLRLVEASAYLGLTLPLVRYRTAGIRREPDGRIVAPNRLVAKVSRIEVARRFLSPPPEKFLRQLVDRGELSAEQAEWAARIPMAEDLTAEADSGGHTDSRPALSLLPTMLALRDTIQAEQGYDIVPRVGAAGGIGTPAAAAAAFAMGAAYVVTGTVNQACVESGASDRVRAMLAEAEQADVVMAPAADMFEMGVQVQVLKRGTMFAMRGAKLFELYQEYPSLEALPAPEREKLEKTIFREPLDKVWQDTRAFFARRDPSRLERADRDPKYRMALVFRSYLGRASTWANQGVADRQMDYQVWCGPAMGAFNEWVRGSFLEPPEARRVDVVSMNLLFGAAVLTRAAALRGQGVALPPAARLAPPRGREAMEALLT